MKSYHNKTGSIFLFISLLVISCNNKKGKEEHAGHQERVVKDIELDALLRPANAFVISSIPVTTIEQREQDAEFAVVGTIGYDTRQLGAISSRIGGRIEKLYVRYKYQPVKKGQRIMDIYSPELMTAQQNLLFLLRNDPENASFIAAARERLLLLGMSSAQIEDVIKSGKSKHAISIYSNYSGFVTDPGSMNSVQGVDNMQPMPNGMQQLSIKEGMYVQAGQPVFSVYNSTAAWILLDIFPEQQNSLKVGDAVRIVPETAPAKNFRAKIDYLEPVFRTGSKTLTARVYFDNSSLALPIGSRVTANIFSSTIHADWLPKEAVLSLGRDKIVFKKEPGGFRAHKVVTGLEVNRLVQITGGINRTDSVAINAQYLVDNEAFIKVN
jgi:membrane fusion protein, copper/silver efflux system